MLKTFDPSSCEIASAIAVFPVPGAPAKRSALPAIFFCLINSTTIPAASLAISCPTIPEATSIAVPSSLKPNPLTWEWEATLWVFVVDFISSI